MHRLMIYGKGGPYGTKSKRRIIPLSPRAQPLVEGHLALHDRFGMSASTIQRLIKVIANRANISRRVTPHVLRHTFSVTAVQKDISLPSLQKLLGHDRLTTTEIYLNLSPEEAIREFQKQMVNTGYRRCIHASHVLSESHVKTRVYEINKVYGRVVW